MQRFWFYKVKEISFFFFQKSVGKVVQASIFLHYQMVLMIGFLDEGRTIIGNYYSMLLTSIWWRNVERRPGKLPKKVVFPQENAPARKCCYFNNSWFRVRITGTPSWFHPSIISFSNWKKSVHFLSTKKWWVGWWSWGGLVQNQIRSRGAAGVRSSKDILQKEEYVCWLSNFSYFYSRQNFFYTYF